MEKKHIENWIKKKKEHRGAMTPEQIFDGIRSGDAGALGSGITLIESRNAEHREDANDLVKLCLAHRGGFNSSRNYRGSRCGKEYIYRVIRSCSNQTR